MASHIAAAFAFAFGLGKCILACLIWSLNARLAAVNPAVGSFKSASMASACSNAALELLSVSSDSFSCSMRALRIISDLSTEDGIQDALGINWKGECILYTLCFFKNKHKASSQGFQTFNNEFKVVSTRTIQVKKLFGVSSPLQD